MSTKAIREALEAMKDFSSHAADVRRAEAALVEVEAIEKAARDLTRLNLGDYVYNVRNMEHVMAETPDGSSTWEHPDVTAWSDASAVLRHVSQSAPTTSPQGKK